MEVLSNFLEIIKGNNGTWVQAIINGLILNIRFILGLVILIYFIKKLNKIKSFETVIVFISFIFMVTECRLFYDRRKLELLHNEVSYFNQNTENLIIVVQGANNPFNDAIDYNKTQVDFTKSRDIDGLSLIENKLSNPITKVITYVGTHSYTLTPEDVYETVYYFRLFKPKGKIILVGHSVGGYGLTEVLDKLNDNNVSVDLVVFLDNANKLYNNFDYNVKSNVKYVINFTSPKWADNFYFFTNAGGVVSRCQKNNVTNILNLEIPKTTHTSIDNKIPNDISNIIYDYLKNNSNPINFTKKYKF
jgi:uncharacterized protein YkvS